MLYLWLKYINIVSSALLFGTSLGISSVMLYGHWTRNIKAMAPINRYVVFSDWLFTSTAGLILPMTILWMIFLDGYSFQTFWIFCSLTAFALVGLCWIIIMFLQIKISQITTSAEISGDAFTRKYYIYFKIWQFLRLLFFSSLIAIFYLLVFRPVVI